MRLTEQSQTRVLIVDDDIEVRDLLTQLLVSEGYQVNCAANGLEAFVYLRNKQHPDLILLDLRLPIMDGWEFLERRTQYPSIAAIPVMVLTGDREAKHRAAMLGVISCLTKPVDVDLLLDTACLVTSKATRYKRTFGSIEKRG
ncbi:MAG: response regulator [Acidobacteriota bacterium]